MDLPNLTEKENKCLIAYLTNGYKKSEAYKSAYDTSKMKSESVYVEASRFFKLPKIALWLDYYENNIQKTIQQELNYSALDAMKEYEELQLRCSKSYKTYNVEKGCIDSKCKLAGLFDNDKENFDNGNITVMGNININDKEKNFEVGESIDDTTARNS